MIIEGQVYIKPFGRGTKSEHDAVHIQDKKGVSILIRRKGRNPFSDEDLLRLEGKTIRAEGTLRDYVFFVDSWIEL